MNDNLPADTQNYIEQQGADEISLLDLLTVVVENLKLLLLGPLIVGLIALGISFAIPPTYTAKTTMIPPSSGGVPQLYWHLLGGCWLGWWSS